MKDIIIKGNHITRELKVLLYCYILANLVNVYAIVKYNTDWIELITWQRFIILITVIFYIVTVILRLVIFGARKLISKTARANTNG
ncbi:MAG: hypothetical protein EA361_04605 [Bacteroidetes bacterium]|nr:MAG: hypothetical protein EA361_04605 [Bacteroidota bacterium]